MRVKVLPDKMGAEGVKARVTGTDALPETRSSNAMPKEERVRLGAVMDFSPLVNEREQTLCGMPVMIDNHVANDDVVTRPAQIPGSIRGKLSR